jgi:hypothetical protein
MEAVIPGANMSIIKKMVSPALSHGQWRPSKGRRASSPAGTSTQVMVKPHNSQVGGAGRRGSKQVASPHWHLDEERQKL